jgi:hypothetical protein
MENGPGSCPRRGARGSQGHPNHPAEAPVALAGRGASRSGSASLTTMHALFKAKVECKTNGLGQIILFADSRVRVRPARHIEQIRRHTVRHFARAKQQKSLPQPHVRNAAAQMPTAVSAKSPELPAATRADFDPNGFGSSSPTTRSRAGIGSSDPQGVTLLLAGVLHTPIYIVRRVKSLHDKVEFVTAFDLSARDGFVFCSRCPAVQAHLTL